MSKQDTDRPLVYLASPYTHDNAHIRAKRAHQVGQAGAALLTRGWPLYVPIAHGHAITTAARGSDARILDAATPECARFWDDRSDLFLHLSHAVIVLLMTGWATSRGVEREIGYAKRHDLILRYLDPADAGKGPEYLSGIGIGPWDDWPLKAHPED